MHPTARETREAQIADAAYKLIEEKGFSGCSMLAVARAAKASNETLYNWYGDKTGLFRRLIELNADAVCATLDAPADNTAQTLANLGPTLLTLLVSDRAIALNRAAAGDPTGSLGAALAMAGRGRVLPKIATVLVAAKDAGILTFDDLDGTLALYINLLVGDAQIRRATGAMPAPDDAWITARATAALTQFLTLTAPVNHDAPHP